MTPCVEVMTIWCIARCVRYAQSCPVLSAGMQGQFTSETPDEWYCGPDGHYRCLAFFKEDDFPQ